MIPVLETERLVLRALVPADAPALYAFRSDPIEQRWNDPPLTEPAQAGELIERLALEHRTRGALHWGLALRGDDTARGLLGYNEVLDEHARAAIGWNGAGRVRP